MNEAPTGSTGRFAIMPPVRSECQQSDKFSKPRRNISIFSRRGTATPEPINLSNVQDCAGIDVEMPAKQKRLILCKKAPNGTVLHAVPAACVEVLKQSTLEDRMATDPNNEILSAISDHTPTLPWIDENPPSSPSSISSVHSRRMASAGKAERVLGLDSSSSRIGVWADGVVHWDDQVAIKSSIKMKKPATIASGRKLSTFMKGRKVFKPWPVRPIVLMPSNAEERSTSVRTTRNLSNDAELLHPSRHTVKRKDSFASMPSRSSLSDDSHVEGSSVCSRQSSATSVDTPVPAKAFSHTYHNSPKPIHYTTAMQSMRSRYLLDATSTSPTLSQAEDALNKELDSANLTRSQSLQEHEPDATSIDENQVLRRNDSVRKVMQPPSLAPSIPRRSRKREWRTTTAVSAAPLGRRRTELQSRVPVTPVEASNLRKSASVSNVKDVANPDASAPQPSLPRKSSRRPASKTSLEIRQSYKCAESCPGESLLDFETTEDVLLHIMSCLRLTKDLINTALINKGMYRVYKENEMELLHSVIYNESPAAWEFHEWCSPAQHDLVSTKRLFISVHPALTYMRHLKRDRIVVERLKQMILGQCQTFIRRETAFALSTLKHPQASRFDDAFWRVWCFCRIFGSGKRREEDITGQVDWLKGGLIANEESLSATVDANFDVDTGSVLLNPPECFARGNQGGLTAAQLFDMTEIWTCMTVLLQGYHGQLGLARHFGVFDNCNVQAGDVELEEAYLEEWTAHLLTLGLNAVLEMAELASDDEGAGFAIAQQNGWTHWSPPVHQGSRRNFLKEPVSRCYEDQVALQYRRLSDPHEKAMKDVSRRRVSSLAAEIKLRRQSSDYRNLPLIDMAHERAMSMTSRQTSRQNSISSARSEWTEVVSPLSSTPRGLSNAQYDAPSPVSLWAAPRNIAPIIEERVSADSLFVERNYGGGHADDTSTRAVRQLVAMGFPVHKVKEALRRTDMGDGLRVDRAVELLLREQQ